MGFTFTNVPVGKYGLNVSSTLCVITYLNTSRDLIVSRDLAHVTRGFRSFHKNFSTSEDVRL